MVDLEGSSRPDLPRSQVLRAGSERRRMGRRDAKNRGQMTEGRGWPLPKAGDYCAQRRQDAEASGISLSGYGCEARFVGRLASGVASRATVPCPAVPSPLAPRATCTNKPNSRRSRVGRGRRDEGRGTRGKCAKRTQFLDCGFRTGDGLVAGHLLCGLPPRACAGRSCKTNPIRPEPREGQVLCRERVMMNRASKRLPQNKANCRRRRAG